MGKIGVLRKNVSFFGMDFADFFYVGRIQGSEFNRRGSMARLIQILGDIRIQPQFFWDRMNRIDWMFLFKDLAFIRLILSSFFRVSVFGDILNI